MKKIICMLCSMLLLCTLFAGCSKGSDKELEKDTKEEIIVVETQAGTVGREQQAIITWGTGEGGYIVTGPTESLWKTIPLNALSANYITQVEPKNVALERHVNDCREILDEVEEYSLIMYRSTDGNVYAAILKNDGSNGEDWAADVFLTIPANRLDADTPPQFPFPFDNLLGYKGTQICYEGWIGYYTFIEDGTPMLLAEMETDFDLPWELDLDGDGSDELISDDINALFFRRDGKLFRVDIAAAVASAFDGAEPEDFGFGMWGEPTHISTGFSLRGGEDGAFSRAFCRNILFDGERLLIYRYDDITHNGHVMIGVEVPDQVLADVLAAAEAEIKRMKEQGFDWIDDWCIYSVERHESERDNYTLEAYEVELIFHTSDPAKAARMKGAVISEDDWVSNGNGCVFFYSVTKDGTRQRLEGTAVRGVDYEGAYNGEFFIETEVIEGYVELTNGLCKPSEMASAFLAVMINEKPDTLNYLGACGKEEYSAILRRVLDEVWLDGLPETLERIAADDSIPLTEEGREALAFYQELVQQEQEKYGGPHDD